MTRAGREPTEDVKRRLVSACQEVGLTVDEASMHLRSEAGVRVVYVGASFPEWPYKSSTVSVMAMVPITGNWPEFVDIRCCATEGDPALCNGPWMRGRDKVSFREMVEQLQATLDEREQVIAAMKSHVPGPYCFERSMWANLDQVAGIAPEDVPPDDPE